MSNLLPNDPNRSESAPDPTSGHSQGAVSQPKTTQSQAAQPVAIADRTKLSQYTEDEIVEALLNGGGDFITASLLLNPNITADELKLYTARNRNILEALKDYHKIDTLASLSRLTHLMHIEISQRLGDITADNLVKSHSLLVERMLDLLDGRFKTSVSSTTNISNNVQVDAILKSLPTEIRQQVIDLVAQPPTDDSEGYEDVE